MFLHPIRYDLSVFHDLQKSYPRVPSGYLVMLFDEGRVLQHGQHLKPLDALAEGEVVEIEDEESNLQHFDYFPDIQYANVNSLILYQDKHLIVCNKPKGLLTVGKEDGRSLSSYLRRAAKEKGEELPSPINRLDRNTSGVVLFGCDSAFRAALTKAWEERNIHKEYLALVYGKTDTHEGEINQPLRKDIASGEVVVDPNGKPSLTSYSVVEEYEGYTLVRCVPHTGRNHQIRVHLASIGHPIVGDFVYASKEQVLEAAKLGVYDSFLHCEITALPTSLSAYPNLAGKIFHASLPTRLERVLDALRAKH